MSLLFCLQRGRDGQAANLSSRRLALATLLSHIPALLPAVKEGWAGGTLEFQAAGTGGTHCMAHFRGRAPLPAAWETNMPLVFKGHVNLEQGIPRDQVGDTS